MRYRESAWKDIKKVRFSDHQGHLGYSWHSRPPKKYTVWQKARGSFTSDKATKPTTDVRSGGSSISLAWMISELYSLGKKH